jgi:hypothetical protein
MNEKKPIGTLAEVLDLIDQVGLTGTRRRDMVSAINRIFAKWPAPRRRACVRSRLS